MQIRDYAAPEIYDSIITEFSEPGVWVDGAAGLHLTNGLPDLRNNLWWNFAANGTVVAVSETPQAQLRFIEAACGDKMVNLLLRFVSRTNNSGLDPCLQPGKALTSSRLAPQDCFYMSVAFEDAFNKVNWAYRRTALSE